MPLRRVLWRFLEDQGLSRRSYDRRRHTQPSFEEMIHLGIPVEQTLGIWRDITRATGFGDPSVPALHAGYIILLKRHLNIRHFRELSRAGQYDQELSERVLSHLLDLSKHILPATFPSLDVFRTPEVHRRDLHYWSRLIQWADEFVDDDQAAILFSTILRDVSGRTGILETPDFVVRAMTALAAPRPGEVVCDPSAGTAKLLVEAHNQVVLGYPHSENPLSLWAYDKYTTQANLGALNLLLSRIPDVTYRLDDVLSQEAHQPFDVILSTPPFGKVADKYYISRRSRYASSRRESLFLEWALESLKPNGRCVMLVPDGLLFSTAAPERSLRKLLLEEAEVGAVISLPTYLFAPVARIKVSIIGFRRGRPTRDVRIVDLTQIDKGQFETELNRAVDLIHQGGESKQIRIVTADQLALRDWGLSASLYQTYEQSEAVEAPGVLINRIRQLESELMSGLDRLDELIRGERHG